MTNYPVGDYLIRIKNAAMAGKRELSAPNSRLVLAVAKELKNMGILEDVSIKDAEVVSRLAYHKKEPVLIDLKLVSVPGLRRYMSVDDMKKRKRAFTSVLLLSTPEGILSSKKAFKKAVGGEVIAEIW